MKIADALEGVNRIGVDTSPFIYVVEKHPTYFARTMAIFTAIDQANISVFSGILTLTEVLTQPLKQNRPDLVREYEEILSNSRHFQLIPISQLIARRAANLRARYNLRTPDALQLASTIQQRCDAFLTNDAGLKRVQEIRVLLIEELELSDPST